VDTQADLVIPPLPKDAGSAAPQTKPEPVAKKPSFEIAARDPRPLARFPRSEDVVKEEISQLAHQNGSAPAPERVHQIGDAYSELGDHRQAAKVYEGITTQFPTYTAIDEVRYYLGVEYELAGDFRNARKAYYDLIVKNPASKLIPCAYFAFGEMFFAEAKDDPSKNDLAQQAYMEVLKYQATPLAPDALMRLAQTYARKGDDAKALATWTRLKRDYPNSEAATKAP